MMKDDSFKFDDDHNAHLGDQNQFFDHRKQIANDDRFADN